MSGKSTTTRNRGRRPQPSFSRLVPEGTTGARHALKVSRIKKKLEDMEIRNVAAMTISAMLLNESDEKAVIRDIEKEVVSPPPPPATEMCSIVPQAALPPWGYPPYGYGLAYGGGYPYQYRYAMPPQASAPAEAPLTSTQAPAPSPSTASPSTIMQAPAPSPSTASPSTIMQAPAPSPSTVNPSTSTEALKPSTSNEETSIGTQVPSTNGQAPVPAEVKSSGDDKQTEALFLEFLKFKEMYQNKEVMEHKQEDKGKEFPPLKKKKGGRRR